MPAFLPFVLAPLLVAAGGSSFAAVADTQPKAHVAPHHAQAAPKQRWGAAGHGGNIKADGVNRTVPGSWRTRYPLRPVPPTPKPRLNRMRVLKGKDFVPEPSTASAASSGIHGTATTTMGFDPAKSREIPSLRTPDQRVYQNPDGTQTTEFSPSTKTLSASSVKDPTSGGASSAMTVRGSSSSSGSDQLLVGDQGGSDAAAYLKFSSLVSSLQYNKIFGAQLVVTNYDGPSCKARPLNVYEVTGSWTAGTGYSFPGPALGNKLASSSFANGYIATGNASSACPATGNLIDLGVPGRDLVQRWVNGDEANNGISLRAKTGDASAWKRLAGTGTANPPKLAVTHTPYNASYSFPSQVPITPVLQNKSGTVSITVTNKGAETWTPSTYYLAYRVFDNKTGKSIAQVKSASLTTNVARNAKVTLTATINALPVSTYTLNFTMVKAGGPVFTDEQIPPGQLYLAVFDLQAVVKHLYPDNGYQSGTLRPQLWASAIDPDAPDSTLKYLFKICEVVPTGQTAPACVTKDYASKPTWNLPAGTLSWSKQYKWSVTVKDSNGKTTPSGDIALFTSVPQPAITSKIGAAPYVAKDQEFDPQVGNLTTAGLEAPVITAGPDLNVLRTYNSLDPRTDGAFGAGWTTRYDMHITADDDGSGSVVIRYPDGQEVRFGQNNDGTYVAPTGRTTTLTVDSSTGAWKLTDHGKSVYRFDSTGRLTQISDAYGRTIAMTYDTGTGKLAKAQVTNSATGLLGRALTFTWNGNHVASVSTDPLNGKPLTWTYTYNSDLLTKVCSPTPACTTYDYTSGSHYRSAVLDDHPESYYRLGDAVGGTAATSEVAVNLGADQGTYAGATLGAAGVIAGSPDTAVTLNGTSGAVTLPIGAIKKNHDQAIELWFKTPANGTGGPLVGYQDADLAKTPLPTLGVPALYVDTDGHLRGQLNTGTIAPITSTAVVNDGSWHYAVLSVSGSTQTLFLDGKKVGTLSGTVSHDTLTFNQLGEAYATTPASWPKWGTTAKRFFAGSLDEAAFYGRPLGAGAVAAHYALAKTATTSELTKVTLPSGKIASQTSYDVSTDRVSDYVDRHGGDWKVGAPMIYGNATDLRRSIQVRDPRDRPYLYEFDALAGRMLRSGMPTGEAIREEDKAPTPTPSATTPPSNCTAPSPTDPTFCTLVPGDSGDPVFYTLDGFSVRSYHYDDAGNQDIITDENGNSTTLKFDARGNVIKHTTCRTTTTDCQSDYSAYPSTVTDPLDPRNDLVTETRDARSSDLNDTKYLTKYSYNFAGDLTLQTNPDGGQVKHTYTTGAEFGADGGFMPAGLLQQTTDALNGITKYSYLSNGDLDNVVEPTGRTTYYTYDALGRKTSEKQVTDSFPNGTTTSYGYDEMGRMTSMTEAATTDAVTGTKHQRRTVYTFDVDGNVLTTSVSDLLGGDATRTTTYEYDDFNNVSRLVDAEGNESTYGYDEFGNRTSMTDEDDRRYEYGYTARNALAETRLVNWNGDPSSAPSTPQYLILHEYTFDLGGRMLSDTDAMGRELDYSYYLDNTLEKLTLKNFHNPDGTTRDFVVEADTYDAAGNLATQTTGNNTLTTTNVYTPTGQVQTSTSDPKGVTRQTFYKYDLEGNVTLASVAGGWSNVNWPVFSASQDVSYKYDTAGRQTQQIQTDGTDTRTTSYTYDQNGLVTSVTDPRGNVSGATAADFTATYQYDEQGRQIKSTAPAVKVESNGGVATSAHPVSLTGYDTFDDATSVKDPDGNISQTTYDRLGRQVSQIGTPYTPPGTTTAITPTSTTQYDGVGNVTQVTDPRKNVTHYGYDRLDRLSSRDEPTVDNNTRAVWHYSYTRTGEVLSVTDPRGAQVQSTYDDLDRPVTSTQVVRQTNDNFTTKYQYDDAGNLVTATSPTGATTTNYYDTLGQLTSTKDPSGVITTHGYDFTGREVRLTDGLNRTSQTTYDGFGQVVEDDDVGPDNTTLRTQNYTYDPSGNLLSAKNGLGTLRTYQYDALGRLTQQTEPVTASHSITTSFGYDAAGNRTRYTDGRQNATISTVNSWGLPQTVVEPSTTAHPASADRTWTMSYDANGNPVKLAAPGGVSRTRTFDAADRLSTESGTGAAAATVGRTLGYDSIGELTSVSAPGGTNTYGYDDRGLMTSATGPSGTATFGYNGDGNVTSRSDGAGNATFTYLNGRLDTEKDGITASTQTMSYDASGALKTIDYGSGRLRTYGYDDFGRTASDTLKNTAGSVVSSITYKYNLDDEMTTKNTTGTAGASDNTYDYDLAGRLTSWKSGTATTGYTWDDAGNRTQAGPKTASYDERNELLSDSDYTYTYKPDGSMASRTSSGLTEPFSFDAFDRLVTQGTGSGAINYTYDGLDRLASRSGTMFQYAGADDDPVSDGTENYAHGAYDELLAISRGTSKRLTVSDQHDDLVGAFDPANTALTSLNDSTSFDPFGQVLSASGTKHDVGFQGDYTDPSSGEVDMGARWYMPNTGDFISEDSAGYSSGPSILANKYDYGAGDPMDYNDPDGNWPSCSLCHKVTHAVGSALSYAGGAIRSGASYIYSGVRSFAGYAWSAIKAAGRAFASGASYLYHKGKAALGWVGSKLAAAGRWAAGKAAAAASWARQRAEAARQAAIAHARAVTAQAKAAVAAAIKHNPLPAIKAALRPVMAGVKIVVSAAANLPAAVVSATKNAIADTAKATEAIYQKAVDKAGVVVDDISTAASAVGQFAQSAMPLAAGILAGVATTFVCEALSGGIPNPACVVAGFAVGGAVTSALNCAPGRSVVGCAARGGAAGLVGGIVTVSTGGAGLFVSAGLGSAAGDATQQYLDTGHVNATEVGVSGLAGGGLAVGGRAVGRAIANRLATACDANSFIAGTRVLLADGSTKAIEDVEIGDEVLATDPTTGRTSGQPVTDLITGTGEKHLVTLKVETDDGHGAKVETIRATEGHPFWVDASGEQTSNQDKDGGHWSTAGQLHDGDHLQPAKSGGTTVTVLGRTTSTEYRTVYNLTVDGVHTYYVVLGRTAALIHNGAACWSIKGRMRAAGPGTQFGLPNSGRIRYVPPKGYNPAEPLPRGPNNGYIDRMQNEWTVGPSRTEGHPFEWDVQLSRKGQASLGWLSRDDSHVNVDPFGEVTHR